MEYTLYSNINMADERTIRDFFTQEVPSLVISKDFFKFPSVSFLLIMFFMIIC